MKKWDRFLKNFYFLKFFQELYETKTDCSCHSSVVKHLYCHSSHHNVIPSYNHVIPSLPRNPKPLPPFLLGKLYCPIT